MAVLLSTLVLVLGGLASGIATSVDFPNATTAVEQGTQWAEPVLSMILLGLVGLSWWQHQGWMRAADNGHRESDRIAHVARSRRIASWAQIGLLLVVAGSASLFGAVVASELDLPPEAPSFWSPAVFAAASFLAVVVLAGTGLLIGRKLTVDRT
jgi:hypothetical protein